MGGVHRWLSTTLHQCVFPQLYVIYSHSTYSFVGEFAICLFFMADKSCNSKYVYHISAVSTAVTYLSCIYNNAIYTVGGTI